MKTKEEIEYTVSSALQANKTASVYYQQPGIGEFKLEVENQGWYTMFKSDLSTQDKGFYIDIKKGLPFICLFFQIKGGTTFVSQQTSNIPEKHHSLNYLPCFESTAVVNKHTHVQDLSIKITPESLADKLLGREVQEDKWQKFIDENQTYFTLNSAHKMNPVIWDTLFQLLNCPYSGAMGQMYKDLLVRMLFIHQLMSFGQQSKPVVELDTKLQKRDVEVLHAIKEYLELHYLDDLSLDTIVKEFGMNTFKLKYGFKKLFGTPVMKFIDDKKMNYAKQLLQDHQVEIMDIAEKLGYTHYNNFSAAFKRKFGYSPAFFVEKAEYLAHT